MRGGRWRCRDRYVFHDDGLREASGHNDLKTFAARIGNDPWVSDKGLLKSGLAGFDRSIGFAMTVVIQPEEADIRTRLILKGNGNRLRARNGIQFCFERASPDPSGRKDGGILAAYAGWGYDDNLLRDMILLDVIGCRRGASDQKQENHCECAKQNALPRMFLHRFSQAELVSPASLKLASLGFSVKLEETTTGGHRQAWGIEHSGGETCA
jgi:hypothetical protein